MALDVSALTAYVDQLSSGLAKAIVLEADTIKNDLVTVEYGAKGATYQLNVLKFTPLGKSNDGCSTFSNSGTTTFAAPTISIFPIKFEDSVCINDLHKYYTAWEMKATMNGEDVSPFNEVFMATHSEATSREIGNMLWRGANSSPKYLSGGTTGNQALLDGVLQKCYALSASTNTEVPRSAITSSNGYQMIDVIANNVALNTPEIMDEYNIYLNPADFQSYLFSLRSLNLFKYDTESKNVRSILHPGSIGTNVVRVNDLKGSASGTLVATKKENIHIILSDPNDLSYDTWYDKPTDALNFRMKFRGGVGFFQPELVTYTR